MADNVREYLLYLTVIQMCWFKKTTNLQFLAIFSKKIQIFKDFVVGTFPLANDQF